MQVFIDNTGLGRGGGGGERGGARVFFPPITPTLVSPETGVAGIRQFKWLLCFTEIWERVVNLTLALFFVTCRSEQMSHICPPQSDPHPPLPPNHTNPDKSLRGINFSVWN